ncbi:U3 small nucleolar RNA-associated protein 14 homolog A [Anthonomus grandis grandis]|uniref:U3 small nucleolar RNA-associated protein 14 homolog A n=1 Tax=Anthonomus grandis grandis TaxID=2921223 RepID=UPI002166490E|nr:U3 small nucleolar RNA-associated protein 14 homolog A [Anthonomus grandis grandis]
MSDDSDFNISDNDLDDSKDASIVEKVLNLNKSSQLKKPCRTEPALQISEFNLVKSVTGQKGSVHIDDLAKVLKTRKKHAEISKKIDSTKKKSHTLPKPLEKPQREKIKRSVGYEKNRFLFDRWEAFVTANRAQAHHSFPLDDSEDIKIEKNEAASFPNSWTYKSDLEKRLEQLDKVEEYKIEEETDRDETPLTLEELKEKRKEAAKLRAHQSYKEAKARRQNKIKSKKYHRILRKEKIKEKLKEFEELQKTDPEEALKKLSEIEKARALERFSLRHKGTGQWAKSKQVRAKYDKESRQVLAEQLKISRELTQKQKVESESEDEGFVTEDFEVSNGKNPWVGAVKPDKDLRDFVSGYKKFWSEKNKETVVNGVDELKSDELKEKQGGDVKVTKVKKRKVVQSVEEVPKLKKKKSDKPKTNMLNASGEWDIEDLFENAERKIEKKLKKQKGIGKVSVKKVKKPTNKATKTKVDLAMPKQTKKQIIDEELIEKPSTEPEGTTENISNLNSILNSAGPANTTANLNPEQFVKPTATTTLDSAMPDLITENENPTTSQRSIIMEALEDNDIEEDFNKEKQAEIDKDKPQDIDLNLPGWGSWAGTGIDPKKQRKRKRFIVKMPKEMPRRDENKGALIINEKAALKAKPHLVSEVPFPFKSVKDYEASIRAPIGNTFVPELAFRRFIKPTVETRMGAIIEPVTVSNLMGKPKKK